MACLCRLPHELLLHALFSGLVRHTPGDSHSQGAAFVREVVWLLSRSSPPTLWGGLGSPLSPDTFATLLPQFCHFRKGPSVRASDSEPFAFGGFQLKLIAPTPHFSTLVEGL